MSAHTSGPWEKTASGFQIYGPPDPKNGGALRFVVCEIRPSRNVGEFEANADLIAAAPQMLAALKAAKAHMGDRLPRCPLIDAAIAKAEGKLF